MSKYFIETYGCPMNKAESDGIALLLESGGYEEAKESREADVVIINTCSVRGSAENRIWGRLGYYSALKEEKDFKLILTGCMADRLLEDVKKRNKDVDFVVTNNNKINILSYLNGNDDKSDEYRFIKSYNKSGEESAYVPIMNGCNNFCSYCIVPYVRGREVSRNGEDIINEIISLDEKNVREVTLLGQNVNSYKGLYKGLYIDFPSLLEAIVPHLKNIQFLRFDSPHPKDFSSKLIALIAREDKISSHIHLPLQSGSTRILSLMNRKNSREEAFSLIDEMRSKIKDVSFSTDIIVGFPSESESEYEETLSLMDYLSPSEAFMYYYNPIKGTRSYDMDGQIEQSVKNKRLDRLIKEQLERQKIMKSGKGNFEEKVIVLSKSKDDEDRFLCRSSSNEYFSILPKTPVKVGNVLFIKVDSLSGNTYRGHEIGRL